MKIDFIVTWVDGSDTDWQKQKSLYTGTSVNLDDVRYRDWGGFKYWFRAIEKYAPWVNKVFLVTSGQVPDWLNINHPKLRLVFHKDYIPEECLPTFSANPIELNFHRINELSEHFVYFNDDTYLNSSVDEIDYFRDDLPCLSAVLSEFVPTIVNDEFLHIMCNDISFLNKYFSKKDAMKRNFSKWFSPVYGKYLFKNAFYCFGARGFSMLQNFHMPTPMRKSTFEKVWALEPELMHETSRHKIRNLADVNQYIMSYYEIGTGNFVPRNPNNGHYYELGKQGDILCADIINAKHKMICINDSPCQDFVTEIQNILRAFEEKFPQKSSYELP